MTGKTNPAANIEPTGIGAPSLGRQSGVTATWLTRAEHLLTHQPNTWAYWDHDGYTQTSKLVKRWNASYPDTPLEGTCCRLNNLSTHRTYLRVTILP